MDFVDDNHLDESTFGKGLDDRLPGVARGQLWPNKQVNDHVVDLIAVIIEGQKTFDRTVSLLLMQ